MNAEWFWFGRVFFCLPALAFVLALAPRLAGAWEVTEVATPFRDPLLTAPKELVIGVALPGDSQPVSCPAFKDFSTPLALTEAVDLALCNNTQVRVAWAEIKARVAAVGIARAAYLPSLSGSASYRNDTTRFSDTQIPTQKITAAPVNGLFSWRLLDFGGRGAGHDAAMHGLAAALASHNALLQQTLATVVRSYFDAQVTRATWLAKSLSENIAKNTLDAAKRREAKGAGTSGDRLQATTALARATLEKNRAEGDYRKALSLLLYGIGLSDQIHATLADDLDDPSASGQAFGQARGQAAQDLDEWLQEAQKRHPAIIAAREQLAAARYQVAATRSEGWPTLDFSAGYYLNGRLEQSATETGSQESVVGVSLSFPFFNGFSHTYKVRASEAEVERQTAQLQDTEQQVLMEMVKAHADAVAALGNLDASDHLLTAADESLRAAQRRYEKGAADILEILNIQNAFFEAQQERIRGLAEWRAAKIRLLATAGALNRTDFATIIVPKLNESLTGQLAAAKVFAPPPSAQTSASGQTEAVSSISSMPSATVGGQADNSPALAEPPTPSGAAPEEMAPVADQTSVVQAIETWRHHWQNAKSDLYLACYSPSFVPAKGMSQNDWRAGRVKSLSLPAMMKITLSNIRIIMQGKKQATATFQQDYTSDRLHDSVIKTLSLRQENGDWKIIKEVVDKML